jgi:hypothetical protein
MVEVTWHDASSTGSWRDVAVAAEAKTLEVRTIGYLLHRDARRLTLVQSLAENEDVTGTMTIPAPWITRVRPLRHRRGRAAR